MHTICETKIRVRGCSFLTDDINTCLFSDYWIRCHFQRMTSLCSGRLCLHVHKGKKGVNSIPEGLALRYTKKMKEAETWRGNGQSYKRHGGEGIYSVELLVTSGQNSRALFRCVALKSVIAESPGGCFSQEYIPNLTELCFPAGWRPLTSFPTGV